MSDLYPAITRYDFIIETDEDDPEAIQSAGVQEGPEGDYVLHSDHVERQERLISIIGMLTVERDEMLCEIERLKDGLDHKELDT